MDIEQRKTLPAQFEAEIPRLAKRYLSDNDALIFVASLAGADVGYLVASVTEASMSGEIEALGVQLPYRRRGVAAKLLSTLEHTLAQRHCLVLTKLYEASEPSVTAIEELLKRQHWKPPQPFIQRHHIDIQTFHPPWMKKEYPLTSEFTIFPWDQLTDDDRRLIERQLKGGTFPASVYPLGDDLEIVEPLNSLGLRHQGVVVGWMVTHRVSPDTIRYAYFYIRDDLRHKGYSMRLLTDAIRIQQDADVPKATFEIRVARVDGRWQRFIESLAPYTKAKSEVRMAWKDLREI